MQNLYHDKEVLLVNLPPANDYRYENAGSIYPATGVMVIASVLRKNGVAVSLVDGTLDCDYDKKVLERISNKTAFVGFSIMSSQIVMAYKLAKKIKEKYPDTLVVFGGVHPTLYPEQIVDNPYIDIGVINEGSKTVLEIMNYVCGKIELKDVRGIVFCDDKNNVNITEPQSLDEIADISHFDFEVLDMNKYLSATTVYNRELNFEGVKDLRLMPIITGLGCCFRCSFCINVILKRRYRTQSARAIVDEIKRLQANYGANAFLFLDEDFCINKKRLKEFIQIVKDQKLEFSARIWTRVSYFKNESFRKLVPEMEKIGIKSIAMGAESGSQRMLDNIKKDIKCEDILCAAHELSNVSITPRFSFMVGLEDEKKDETVATYKLCGKLIKANARTDIAGPFIFRYYPGSPMFNRIIEKYNIQIPETIEQWESVLNVDGSLIVNTELWTWPGFKKYSKAMNDYITLCSNKLNTPDSRNRLATKVIKSMILWRLEYGHFLYSVDYYVLQFARKIKRFLKGIAG